VWCVDEWVGGPMWPWVGGWVGERSTDQQNARLDKKDITITMVVPVRLEPSLHSIAAYHTYPMNYRTDPGVRSLESVC
jgi:hypothetical protein